MKSIYLKLAFFQSVIAMAGSLYFSEVMKLIPCTLCWYQRICMYPLVVILGMGLVNNEKKIYKYVLPLSLAGLIIAIYNNLLIYQVIPETETACSIGAPCSTILISWFGFITIPLLALTAFSIINILMILYIKTKDIDQPKI